MGIPGVFTIKFRKAEPRILETPVTPAAPSPSEAPVPPQPASDFPGGTKRVYSADFSLWPRYNSDFGSAKLGFGNSYVLEPYSYHPLS